MQNAQIITGRHGYTMSVRSYTQSLTGDLVITDADSFAYRNGDRYAITHRLSGYALGWARNLREAEKILDQVSHAYGPDLRRLRPSRKGWGSPTPTCKALGREVQSLIGMIRGDGDHRTR
jgi:hypothetical protein